MQQEKTAVICRQQPVLILWLLLLISLPVSLPVSAHALGFGALTLSSHLNEALKAEIPLILSASDNIDMVHVKLASPSDYQQVELPWQPELTRIKVFIMGKHTLRPRVVLRSVGVIRSTMLSILLKAKKTGRGTYYKHFQLLLDPVGITALQQQQPAVIALRVELDTPVSSSINTQRDEDWTRIRRYGPVRAGDSLSEIAYRLRRDKRFSNRQVMLSLYKLNLHGFVDGDINRLKEGIWLTVPRGKLVKQYAGKAAMHQLSMLLMRRHGAAGTTSSAVKATHVSGITTPETRQTRPTPKEQELRYSGKISINGVSARLSADALQMLQRSVHKKFNAMHAELMAGKLQMTDLGESVAKLKQSMQGIKQDIHALRKDVAMIKNRHENVSPRQLKNWQIALFTLLAGLIGALLTVLLQKKMQLKTAIAPVTKMVKPQSVKSANNVSNHNNADVRKADAEPITNETVQLLNQAEESLGACEYEKAEQLLTQIDTHSPDSLRASALKAQLYHETDRHDARNDLINNISDASDKQRWEDFCKLLPSHIWNACFCGDAASLSAHENSDT